MTKKELYNQIDPTQIPPVKKIKQEEDNNVDFNQISILFWQTHFLKFIQSYQAGYITGKFSKKDLTIEDFFNKIFFEIKESINKSYSSRNKSMIDLTNEFNILQNCLQIISNKIKKEEIPIEEIIAHMHGFINASVDRLNYEKKNKE